MDKHKVEQFTAAVYGAVVSLLIDDETGERTQFSDDAFENATEFFHALSNIAPWTLYTKLVDANLDVLEYNQLTNRLVFQSDLSEREAKP